MNYHRLSSTDSSDTEKHYCERQRGTWTECSMDQLAPARLPCCFFRANPPQMADELCAGLDLLKAGVTGEQVLLVGLAFTGVQFAQEIAFRHQVFDCFLVFNHLCAHNSYPWR